MPDDASRLLVTASKACGTARYGGRHFRLVPDARITQQVECIYGKDEVVSSSLTVSSRYALITQLGRVPDGRGHYVNPLKQYGLRLYRKSPVRIRLKAIRCMSGW